jgi:hypothetical protein
MTNTQDTNREMADVLAQHSRPASRFRPDVIGLQHQLELLLTTEATGADEDLRRSRIFDLRKEIATATAERDGQSEVNPTAAEVEQAPRHMSSGKARR